MIHRDLTPRILAAAAQFPALTLTGPRQSGKSTLVRALFPHLPTANLESPDERRFATSDPRSFLARFPNGAVLDEVQRAPELASYLQPIIDADPRPGLWVLTGAQNFALLESVSQSLAGRTAVLHLLPLAYPELLRFARAPRTLDDVLFIGAYPAIFDRGIDPATWLAAHVATYVERDVRTITRVGDLLAFQRFVELCAGRTAQLLNLSHLADDAGISQPTAKSWLSILEASFLVFRVPAWSRNATKRLTKAPKLHFYDTGLVCWLLGMRSAEHLRSHPLRGPIFETWVASEIAKHELHRGERARISHLRTAHGGEVDLVVERGTQIVLVETKAGQTVDSEAITKLLEAAEVLALPSRRMLVYGGDTEQRRSGVDVIPWQRLAGALDD